MSVSGIGYIVEIFVWVWLFQVKSSAEVRLVRAAVWCTTATARIPHTTKAIQLLTILTQKIKLSFAWYTIAWQLGNNGQSSSASSLSNSYERFVEKMKIIFIDLLNEIICYQTNPCEVLSTHSFFLVITWPSNPNNTDFLPV